MTKYRCESWEKCTDDKCEDKVEHEWRENCPKPCSGDDAGSIKGSVCVPVPELVICNHASECKAYCSHKEPHSIKEFAFCSKPCGGLNGAVANAVCVPVPEEQLMICNKASECKYVCHWGHKIPHTPNCQCEKGCGTLGIEDSICVPYVPEASKPKDNLPYFCFVEGRGEPRMQHGTYEVARIEAERLARLPDNLGKRVHVLTSIKYCIAEAPKVIWHKIGKE
jgi:hypothetical protein